MEDEVYALWRSGVSAKAIAIEFKTKLHIINYIIKQTSRKRLCIGCGKEFVSLRGATYCSTRCRRQAHARLDSAPRRKPLERTKHKPIPRPARKKTTRSLDDIMTELAELSKAEGRYISYGEYMARSYKA